MIDLHVHTSHSFDANTPMQTMIDTALKKNIKILAITDHCEMQEFDKGFSDDAKNSYEETASLVSSSKLTLLKGVELGQASQNVEKSKELLKTYDYDFVLGSLHNLKDEEDFYFLEYDKTSVNDLIDRYFDELIELAELGLYDSLAHITYPFRYIIGRAKIRVDLNLFRAKLTKVLKTLIEQQKALELNTSGLRQEIKDFLPSADIIKHYYNLGGRLITIGSDAHNEIDLGAGITEGISLLRDLGFDYITYFVQRKAEKYKI